ncbi:MAG: 2-dehydropantoate 2-reductase [Gammaproteobacteria bacterium]|nr:2-dehydropantoate 2-reductase [Gammaproteobacteria bacterium]NIR83858.1 2-dehydropantoate 2-reductase [Gammaproteobacteria bacterium]NIR88354.1 2-dehydropantoate 2-reductase [Gammaproteobacteria bacterium]NIU05170.1 2-dehydropantoate 2-reductase [Gammaproteobacteria bacterium]NIV51999.1 2-dehydropantoate 2-reductase [Gammaproteobacteria bacterium]
MRIVVVGSGGTGGYFGAKLAKAGEAVTFVARGAHLQAIRENGLTIRSAVEGGWNVRADAVERLDDHPVADLVLLCVKSFDTEDAAELVRPVLGPRTGVLSLQNGIDNEDKIARILGPDHVMGGVAYVFSNIEAPGVIAHHQLGRIALGEMKGGISDRAVAVAEACQRAGIEAEVDPQIRRTLWRKYVFLVALSGTTAVTRLPVQFIREVRATRQLWQRQVEELLALAWADDAGLGTDTMESCVQLLESLAPTNYSSLYHDLMQGKRLELEALHGHAIALGARYNVPTPSLFAVYAALAPYLHGRPQSEPL